MKRAILVLIRLVIGGVFVWAGVHKAWDPAAFAQAVEGYRLLPHAGAVAVALYLPWLEIFCGATLIFGRLRHGSITILSTLLLIFLAALISAWWRDLDINCGCFTSNPEATGYFWPIVRNLMLVAGLVLLLLFEKSNNDRLVWHALDLADRTGREDHREGPAGRCRQDRCS